MTKTLVLNTLAAAAVTAAGIFPAAAQGVHTQSVIAEVQAATPSCAANPQFDVVGRVAGIIGGVPTRGVSFEGCFPDVATCQAWLGPVSGKIKGRLNLAQCSYR